MEVIAKSPCSSCVQTEIQIARARSLWNLALALFDVKVVYLLMHKPLLRRVTERVVGSAHRPMPSSFDIVGDIAIIKVPDALEQHKREIAEGLLEELGYVKVVLRQVTPVSGAYRTRGLEWLAGERRTETIHREHGCLFKVDLAECYFSPRLAYERMRIVDCVDKTSLAERETIVNMFAGVGPFSIIIAKFSEVDRIYSMDLNPVAVRFMRENVGLNRVAGRVVPLEGDSKTIIERRFKRVADRVLMPLPEKSYACLQYGLLALKGRGGWIHYYDFTHAGKSEDPVELVTSKVSEKLKSLNTEFSVPFGRTVRKVGPRYYQVALDIRAKEISA